MKRSIFTLPLILVATLSAAQQRFEILQDIDDDKGQRIAEYNSAFLQEQLYFASRYRIVEVDTDLLLSSEEFTITPFPDVPPIQLRRANIVEYQDSLAIHADVEMNLPEGFEFIRPQILISLLSWDIDERGDAQVSSDNRFEFSPYWRIDEFDRPVLEVPSDVSEGFIGPPPQSPEDIARHKELSRLDKNAFHSVTATIEMPPASQYRLTPLRLTPRYSLIYEVDQEKRIVSAVDRMPSEPSIESDPEQRERIREYREFQAQLPDDSNRAVRGDIE
jgi:hypothetical protein